MEYVAQLSDGVFVAPWEGDPGRTLKLENARRYKTHSAALAAITRARKFRPFLNATVVSFPSKESETLNPK